jgi:hypothetical protein
MDATSVDPSVTVEEEAEELRSTPKSKVDVSQHLAVLKTAAKTRKVPPTELLVAINAIDNAKVDPSDFLQRIGGTTESPGRTWMLIFTADKKTGEYLHKPTAPKLGLQAIFSASTA